MHRATKIMSTSTVWDHIRCRRRKTNYRVGTTRPAHISRNSPTFSSLCIHIISKGVTREPSLRPKHRRNTTCEIWYIWRAGRLDDSNFFVYSEHHRYRQRNHDQKIITNGNVSSYNLRRYLCLPWWVCRNNSTNIKRKCRIDILKSDSCHFPAQNFWLQNKTVKFHKADCRFTQLLNKQLKLFKCCFISIFPTCIAYWIRSGFIYSN